MLGPVRYVIGGDFVNIQNVRFLALRWGLHFNTFYITNNGYIMGIMNVGNKWGYSYIIYVSNIIEDLDVTNISNIYQGPR